ncbi:MAG: 5'-nucleotidase SurE [Alphaproteobacteria bacterium ADurb.Bin438]|nr:MAG: 5'-nucleotidase SurE [Alphaproteobacteria bacterium ADurb.Bin438]
MKILISNDDGYGAEGIVILEDVVKNITDDYYIVAPDGHRSAAGHSISIRNPLYLKKYDERHFSVSGTPADCVVMACSKVIKDKKPDVVLSGINNDKNYGNDVTTSGTFAVAIEGLFQGVKKCFA